MPLTDVNDSLTTIDLTLVGVYLAVMVLVSVWCSRGQRNEDDYLLGGRNMHWFLVAASSIATAFSGISLIGAPGYVFQHDSRMFLAVLVSLITLPVTLLVLPFFLWLKITTVYAYLEQRFSPLLRLIASGMFQASKLGYVAVVIYTPSLLISTATPFSLTQSVFAVGTLATLLTMLGGMKAVIWTDTIQFFIMMFGISAILWFLMDNGQVDVTTMWHHASMAGRTRLTDFSFSFKELTVWAVVTSTLLTGISATFSDQVAMQRYFSTNSTWSVIKSFLTTTALALPMVGLLYLIGILLYGFYADGAFVLPQAIAEQGDKVLPYFIATQIPTGLRGLIMAAIIAATISTVTSVLNSLCATTINDFILRGRQASYTDRQAVRLSRGVTVLWGILGTGLALVVGNLGTIFEQTLTLFGVISGGLGGIFFLGLFTRRTHSLGAIIGGIVGTVASFVTMFYTDIHFLWYYAVGMMSCVFTGYAISLLSPQRMTDAPNLWAFWKNRPSH